MGIDFPPSYEQTQELHYLNAVTKEVSTAYSVFFAIQHVHILRILANGGTSQGMRMHPVIGDILERVVPDGGLTLPDGRVIAPGTKVGINPWVSSRNKDVYGTDSDKFRPERWLRSNDEDEDAFLARLKKINDADLTFGSGKRVCVGRNMANLEIQKIISTLFG